MIFYEIIVKREKGGFFFLFVIKVLSSKGLEPTSFRFEIKKKK